MDSTDSRWSEPPSLKTYAGRSWEIFVPGGGLLCIVFLCFVLPEISSIPQPVGGAVLEANRALFTPGHLLGTDLNGNDILARLLHGGRASLQMAIAVNVIGLLVGGSLGAASAYAGGIVDAIAMRILDMLIAFPSLVLVLAIAHTHGPGFAATILALSFFSVPAFARASRAAVLRMREKEYIMAAKVAGIGSLRILLRHVAPNVLPELGAFGILGLGIVISLEGALSFLGLGVAAPAPSWGNMIAHGQQALSTRPALVLLPSASLFLTVLCFNWLAESLRSTCGR